MATISRTDPIIGGLNITQRTYFLQYARRFAEGCVEINNFRNLLQYRDRAYQLQLDQTGERLKEIRQWLTGSAKRKISDIAVPVVMPQIESAVAYQTGVYLSSYPIFGVVSDPKNADQATQLETVIGTHSTQYGWARELIKVFRNGFKYNFGPAFVHWKRRVVGKITTSTEGNTAGLVRLQQEMIGGNCIKALDPYNCFMDMRVEPAKHHEEGDAFGWNELVSRMHLKRMVETLDPQRTARLKEAFESGYQGQIGAGFSALDYNLPQINASLNISALRAVGTNWLQWSGLEAADGERPRINYKDFYLVTHFICRALPSDFGRQGNTPTIYYGIIINWKEVIYVEEIISSHGYLPVLIMQPNEDGLGYQTQSMLDTSMPFQDMASALWNINLESKRRQVFDRLIYNERFINKADIDPATSVARIPLRNASQFKGDDIGKAIYQIPYREDNAASNLQMSEMISQMADVAAGQNKVDRGQFQKGNKTKTEFETTMVNSNARQQLTSIGIEHQFMVPTKEIVKENILLNQKPGTLYNQQTRQDIEVDPVKLRETLLSFKLTDGLLPAEKLLNMELMTVFLQTAQAMPVVMSEYDVMGMFLYWAKMKGAYWLEDFRRNPEQQNQFMDLYRQTSAAQTAQDPSNQVQTQGVAQ